MAIQNQTLLLPVFCYCIYAFSKMIVQLAWITQQMQRTAFLFLQCVQAIGRWANITQTSSAFPKHSLSYSVSQNNHLLHSESWGQGYLSQVLGIFHSLIQTSQMSLLSRAMSVWVRFCNSFFTNSLFCQMYTICFSELILSFDSFWQRA